MENKSIVIDYTKAFLIACVILAHIIEVDVDAPFFLLGIYKIIYSFVLGVFFAISGYLISKTALKNERWGAFWHRFLKRFIIPFIIALTIERLLRSPNWLFFLVSLNFAGQFWFIATLILFILLLKISYALNFSKLKQILLYSVFTIVLVIDALTIQSFQTSYFHTYYFPFFLIGHYWNDYNWKLPKFYPIIFLISWIFLLISIFIDNDMLFIPTAVMMLSATLFCLNFIHNSANELRVKRIALFVCYGRNTLPVYLYHYLFILVAHAIFDDLAYYLVAIGFSSILIILVYISSRFFNSDKIIWLFGIKPLTNYSINK